MLKARFLILLSILFIFLLAGCGTAEVDESKKVKDEPEFTMEAENSPGDSQPLSVSDNPEEAEAEMETEQEVDEIVSTFKC